MVTRLGRCGLVGIGLAGLLSACATTSRHVEFTGPGVASSADLRFTFEAEQNQEAILLEDGKTQITTDHSVTALVVQGLQKRGMVPSKEPRSPYFLEVAYSDRPVLTGAFVEASADPVDTGQWLVAPGKKAWWTSSKAHTCTLTLRLSAVSTGEDIYRARVAERSPRAGCAAIAPLLADAALKAMPFPPTSP